EAATRADGTPPISDQSLLAIAQGRRFVIDRPGKALGAVGDGELDLVVHPDHRGRGIGREVLHTLLGHALREHGDDHRPPLLHAWAHGENAAATALLREAGFEPIRTLLRMTLEPAKLD